MPAGMLRMSLFTRLDTRCPESMVGGVLGSLTVGFVAGLSVVALTWASTSSDPNPEPESAPVAPVMGSIVAHVQVAGLPGAVPVGGLSTPKLQVLGPASGATIQIIDPLTPDT